MGEPKDSRIKSKPNIKTASNLSDAFLACGKISKPHIRIIYTWTQRRVYLSIAHHLLIRRCAPPPLPTAAPARIIPAIEITTKRIAAESSVAHLSHVKALVFDVFGTVVDWRGSIARDLAAFGAQRGIAADWVRFTDDWRALYQPAMDEVRTGRRAWTILDILHKESLITLLERYGIKGLSDADIDHLTRAWHRLDPWPDTIAGLTRLKQRYIIGPMSNGNVGLLTRMGKHAGLPWDVILGAETARAYKPLPESYLRNAALLNLEPGEVMLVAAHNNDLAAAAAVGLATAFVSRPTEYGPGQTKDLAATGPWNVVTDSFVGLADKLECPA